MLEEDTDNPLASLETSLKAYSPSRVYLCPIWNQMYRLPQMSTDGSKLIKCGRGLLEEEEDGGQTAEQMLSN